MITVVPLTLLLEMSLVSLISLPPFSFSFLQPLPSLFSSSLSLLHLLLSLSLSLSLLYLCFLILTLSPNSSFPSPVYLSSFLCLSVSRSLLVFLLHCSLLYRAFVINLIGVIAAIYVMQIYIKVVPAQVGGGAA